MKWPWSPSDFAEGAVPIARVDLGSVIRGTAPEAEIDDEFDHFLLLAEDQLRRLVWKYHENSYISYGADAPDFPLCYDFAELCSADVRKGAIKEGLKYRPAFGVLRYTKKNGSRHAICFGVVVGAKLKFFEPQPVEFPWSDAPADIATMDAFDI